VSGGAAVALSAGAAAEWTRIVEDVMRGIGHALNNRAAALSAVIELTAPPAEEPAVIREILRGEMDKVQAIVQVLRSVGGARSDAEAFTPGDVAGDARLVLEYHAEWRDRIPGIDAGGAAPIRAPRWMFTRALVALACAMLPSRTGAGAVRIATEDDWVVVRADAAAPSPLVVELAVAMGGEPLGKGVGFRLPTLAALRRREGR
jgi:hypothetical protein